MTRKEHLKWIEYRNYLECLACTMNVYTIEYRNVCKRADYAHERAYRERIDVINLAGEKK